MGSVPFSRKGRQGMGWAEAVRRIRDLDADEYVLDLDSVFIDKLPPEVGDHAHLNRLWLDNNCLAELPPEIGKLTNLTSLWLSNNALTHLPPEIGKLTNLTSLWLSNNRLADLPRELGDLTNLTDLWLDGNRLPTIPTELARLSKLVKLDLRGNPLNPELAAAYNDGLVTLLDFLRQQALDSVELNEAKLIIVGEGEVGKTCLLDALRGDPWKPRPTTHGIEIRPLMLSKPGDGHTMTLNAWDFGGQAVYRSTHQMFFSQDAVYLIVWKPREGSQQDCVRDWLEMVKARVSDPKVLVVATHGGPNERLPDLGRADLERDFPGTIVGFHHVDNEPPRPGVQKLQDEVAKLAVQLTVMGRKVPRRILLARTALKETGRPYMSPEEVLEICRPFGIGESDAPTFLRTENTLGHLVYYEDTPVLRDRVILRPNWLATALSLVLSDRVTRDNQGLVRLSRLAHLWDNPENAEGLRYPTALHPVFLGLMEKFDLAYRVALPGTEPTYLIAQLVNENPNARLLAAAWPAQTGGDLEQVQVCHIVDHAAASSRSAPGLFYRLIVRQHHHSLGREDFHKSVHWQRGLVLEHPYDGRALLEHVDNDIRITVRAPYPVRFLSVLTDDCKSVVENVWPGLRCEVMVPCGQGCGREGLFSVEKLIRSRGQMRGEYPCEVPGCDKWLSIDSLLHGVPAASPSPYDLLTAVKEQVDALRDDGIEHHRELLSRLDFAFERMMDAFSDEAKDGPRLFSIAPLKPGFLDNPEWLADRYKLTLWCEHSRLPLTILPGGNGSFELEFPRAWLVKAAPLIKKVTLALQVALPAAAAAAKLALNTDVADGLKSGLAFAEAVVKLTGELNDGTKVPGARQDKAVVEPVRAEGGLLRELHVILQKHYPGFGGLVRVQDHRSGHYFWVHPRYRDQY